MQNDFCTGGALAVTDGEKIIEYINRAQEEFETIILTQDWHPKSIVHLHQIMVPSLIQI